MHRVAAWLACVWLTASCAPDYARTAFLCDDQHACPDGQSCVGGRCKRGGPIGDGVVCGPATCQPTEQCCMDIFNGPRCLPAGDSCAGQAARCDGVEDCPTGDRCCDDGIGLVTCNVDCWRTACRDGADCPSSEPNCCFDDTSVTWAACSPFPC